jgi:peptidoglycan/xylan/chitin deacetylase (PgdA/CDA1 family)
MSVADRMRDADRRGRADARAVLERPEVLASTALAEFGAGGPGEAAVRRALHALRIPPAPLRVASGILHGSDTERALALVERYAYWRGARRGLDRDTWRRLTRGPAILMYHAVGQSGEPASRFVLPAPRLERQMRRLARRRLPVLHLDELVEYRRKGALPPAGAVVITFDDGYADTLEVAGPILRRFRFPATVFVVSSRIGGAADWQGASELGGRPLLDWQGVLDLPRSGLAVGAHTRTHPQLPELDAQAASEEIAQSRIDLGERLGTPIRSFAYPYGRTSERTVAAVARAGYDSACGIRRGLNDPGTPLLELRRAPVDGDASMLRFALAVRFGDPDLLAQAGRRMRDAILGRIRRTREFRPQAE